MNAAAAGKPLLNASHSSDFQGAAPTPPPGLTLIQNADWSRYLILWAAITPPVLYFGLFISSPSSNFHKITWKLCLSTRKESLLRNFVGNKNHLRFSPRKQFFSLKRRINVLYIDKYIFHLGKQNGTLTDSAKYSRHIYRIK